MSLERSCESCSKINVCKIYAQAALFEGQFAAEYGDIAKLPFPAKLLALNCKEYTNVVINGKLDWLNDNQLNQIERLDEADPDKDGMVLIELVKAEKLRRARHEEYVATKKMQTS